MDYILKETEFGKIKIYTEVKDSEEIRKDLPDIIKQCTKSDKIDWYFVSMHMQFWWQATPEAWEEYLRKINNIEED